MKSIERKDTGEDWKEYLRRLAAEAGIENPTEEDLRRFDKKRTDKKVSNHAFFSSSFFNIRKRGGSGVRIWLMVQQSSI